jgi:hypothetical protein
MFKIIASPTFTCAVNISVPGSDKPAQVQVTFKHKTARQLSAWLMSSMERVDDVSYLEEVLTDIKPLADADGKPLDYSRDALATLLDQFPASGPELVQAYRRQLADTRAKN